MNSSYAISLIRKATLSAAFILALAVPADIIAQEPATREASAGANPATPEFYSLSGSEKQLIAERIASHNTSWKKVMLNGKIFVDALPIRPTLKVFMEYDKKILISVRAPLFGEVVRIEADHKEVLAINKIKQTYWKADPKEIFDAEPNLISEIQSIFLGRIALLGSGEFKASDAGKVSIVQQEKGDFLVIPEESLGSGTVSMGYSVSPLGVLENIIGVYSGFDGYLDLSFRRAGERLQINGEINGGKRPYGATIELDAPEWDAKGFDRLKIPSNFRQVSFREVLRFN